MQPLQVLVQTHGVWDENKLYVDYESSGQLIPQDCTFNDLVHIIMEEQQCNPETTKIQLRYQLKEGGQPIQIKDEKSLMFYKTLLSKEADFTRYPLCVNVYRSTKEAQTFWEATKDKVCMMMVESDNSSAQSLLQQPFNNTTTTPNKPQSSGQTTKPTQVNTTHSGSCTEETTKQLLLEDDITTVLQSGKFDFTDFAKLVAKEMICQIQEQENETTTKLHEPDMFIITDPRHETIENGQIYKDKETLVSVLSFFAINNSFQYKVSRSCPKEYSIVCLDDNCKWSLNSSKNGKTTQFVIRNYEEEHTCAANIRFGDQRQATSKILAKIVKPKFLNLKTKTSVKDITAELNDKYGIKVNYMKAYRSIGRALCELHGDPKESYNIMPRYMFMVQKNNPGTIVDIEKDEDDHFKYAFLALNAALKGWPYCKPIMVVDGTFLKGSYGGTLLTANAQDAESKIFPLAYGIVDSENDKSWEWFFTKVRNAFGVRPEQCIISDRHESIIKATRKVFPDISHGYCIFHLLANMKTKFRKNAKRYKKPFFEAANAYTETQFELHMTELDDIDKRIRPFLQNIGYEKWTRVHSKNKR